MVCLAVAFLGLFTEAPRKKQPRIDGPDPCRSCAGGKQATDGCWCAHLHWVTHWVGDTALTPERLCRLWRHLCKGGPEFRWRHHRSWSDTSARDRPSSRNSYLHALLDLVQRLLRACEDEGTKRATTQVLNIIQEVPEPVIHLKVGEE